MVELGDVTWKRFLMIFTYIYIYVCVDVFTFSDLVVRYTKWPSDSNDIILRCFRWMVTEWFNISMFGWWMNRQWAKPICPWMILAALVLSMHALLVAWWSTTRVRLHDRRKLLHCRMSKKKHRPKTSKNPLIHIRCLAGFLLVVHLSQPCFPSCPMVGAPSLWWPIGWGTATAKV